MAGRFHHNQDSINLIYNKDSIIVLDFSYTTCGYCTYSIPALKALHEKYSCKGVGLYSVDPFANDWKKIDKFAAYFKVNYPIIEIGYDNILSYGVEAFPTFMVIKNGVVRLVHVGFSNDLEKLLSEAIEANL